MRGIIIEKKWHSAIVMTNNGQFRRLYFPFGREVADEVVLSRQPRMQFAVAAMAVFLLVAGLVGYNTRFQSAAYGFVSIEVNPAAEFQINQYGVVVEAVTVDHGLRPGARAEAAQVAALCGRLGVAHSRLDWAHGAGHGGNLQQAARRARYGLITGWARGRGLQAVLLGQTLEG